jgi:uncharacterized phage-associated protein
MNFIFNEKRSTQAAAFLIARNDNEMNYMKLIKLLYLADRTALLRWQQPITGDTYYSMSYGPVVSTILDKISSGPRPCEPGYWSSTIVKSTFDSYAVTIVGAVDQDELSVRERTLLEEIDNQFKTCTQWDMVDYCHSYLPEWRDPQGSSALITIEDIVKAGNEDASIEEIQEDLDRIAFNIFIDQKNSELMYEAR